MIRLLRTELVLQVRRPRTWVALGFLVVVPIIMAVALSINPPSLGSQGQGREITDRFFFLATRTGLVLPVAALFVLSRFFLVVILCLFAGDAVASEASWGSLRFLLVRPVGRARLLTVKLIVAAGFCLLATVLLVVSALVAGIAAFGWHSLDFGQVLGFSGFVPPGLNQSPEQILVHLGLAILLVTWGLAGIIAFAFMLSTLTDSPAGAVFGAVGFYIVSTILDAISSVGKIRYGLPTHYLDAWTDLFTRNRWTDDMWRSILMPIPYVIVFCGFAWWWFRRKDITS